MPLLELQEELLPDQWPLLAPMIPVATATTNVAQWPALQPLVPLRRLCLPRCHWDTMGAAVPLITDGLIYMVPVKQFESCSDKQVLEMEPMVPIEKCAVDMWKWAVLQPLVFASEVRQCLK